MLQVARRIFLLEQLGHATREVLDVVAVGLGARQGDHTPSRALDRVHRHEQMIAARADVLELSLHVVLGSS